MGREIHFDGPCRFGYSETDAASRIKGFVGYRPGKKSMYRNIEVSTCRILGLVSPSPPKLPGHPPCFYQASMYLPGIRYRYRIDYVPV